MKYKFKKGITGPQINQLLDFTKSDPEVAKFTADLTRFKDKVSAKKFLTECPKVITLIGPNGNLFGIFWFDKKPLPEVEPRSTIKVNYFYDIDPKKYQLTFGIRIYGQARGQGLSQHFLTESFKGINEGVWLSTSFDNAPAVKSYIKFGFKQVSDTGTTGKIIMVRSH